MVLNLVCMISLYKTIVYALVVLKMPQKEIRKIIKSGNTSLAVILPRAWLRYYELNAKDRVLVISNGSVTISPIQKEQLKK